MSFLFEDKESFLCMFVDKYGFLKGKREGAFQIERKLKYLL